MSTDFDQAGSFAQAHERLASLRRFSGPAALFWQNYLDVLVQIAGAPFGLLVRRRAQDEPGWRKIAQSPPGPAHPLPFRNFLSHVEGLAAAAAVAGTATKATSAEGQEGLADHGLAVALATGQSGDSWVAVLLVERASPAAIEQVMQRLRLVACIPAYYQDARSGIRPGKADGPADSSSVLDLLVLLDAQRTFVAMAMAFCNELASRHQCERVSLGWEERGYVRVKAISHSEKFVGKMEAVQSLEAAMEEALDQDEEVTWPPLDGETLVTRDHGKFAAAQQIKHLCSLPLRMAGAAVAVVTLERVAAPFEDDELRQLRICADLCVVRLSDLKARDRWFGARWMSALREKLGGLLGPEHTWAKVAAIGGALALAVLFLGRMTYRVEAPFILRTDQVAFLSAAYDGYVARVDVKIGAEVRAGTPLLALDTRDLLLEEAASLADCARFSREAEKNRAEKKLADMRIAEAQLQQATARLGLVQHRLSKAVLISPFDAVVIEGDLHKRLGAPVRQGDLLFKVGRLDQLYIEARVEERDIQEIREGARGKISFASRPKQEFPLKVVLIEPVAKTNEKGNVFIVRCEVGGSPEKWWRPGMSGVGKIEVGSRTFFWILFHRTIDFLRLLLWW